MRAVVDHLGQLHGDRPLIRAAHAHPVAADQVDGVGEIGERPAGPRPQSADSGAGIGEFGGGLLPGADRR
ncbi:hypothetical protein ACI79G_22015 [Geodermatophilus sp. SYSU D00779]